MDKVKNNINVVSFKVHVCIIIYINYLGIIDKTNDPDPTTSRSTVISQEIYLFFIDILSR